MVSAKALQNACRIILGDEVVGAMIRAQIPLPEIARTAALEGFINQGAMPEAGTALLGLVEPKTALDCLRLSLRAIRAGEYLDGDSQPF